MSIKSTVEKINSVQRRLTIEISEEKVNEAFRAALSKVQREAHIKGFRPGKAPLALVKKLYGSGLASEVGESLISQNLFVALKEQQVNPIATPVVEAEALPKENTPYQFNAVVDILAEINIAEYTEIPVTCEEFTVNDESVDKELQRLLRNYGHAQELEPNTAAEIGHLAYITHTAHTDGQEIPNLKSEKIAVELGGKQLFPELEQGIIGMKKGETKDITIAMPQNYQAVDLAGKEVMVKVTLEDLKKLTLPNLDDEFAKDLKFATLNELKADVHKHLQQHAERLRRQKLEGLLLDHLLTHYPFEVPPAMVDQVIDSMIEERHHKNDKEKKVALRDEELRKSLLPEARKKTQNTLVLWYVSKQEKLEVTEDEVRQHVIKAFSTNGHEAPKNMNKLMENFGPQVKENLLFEKAMDLIIAKAQITNIPLVL